jgi:uncharacterized protein YjbJ (UPF0337 family)
MNTDQAKGNWKQMAGDAKAHWGKLTDDELLQTEGQAQKLAGKVQERYGCSREEAENQVNRFLNKQH